MRGLSERAPEGADNVLLEWATALHLMEENKSSLRAILPVFVGQPESCWGDHVENGSRHRSSSSAKQPDGEGYNFWNDGTMDVINSLPKLVHKPTKLTMHRHLLRAGLVVPAYLYVAGVKA